MVRWDFKASAIVLRKQLHPVRLGSTPIERMPPLLLFQPGAMVHAHTRADAKTLVKNTLFLLQALDGRQRAIVWPQTDCSSPWVGKSAQARHGVSEPKVYAHGTDARDRACYDIGYMNAACSLRGALTGPALESPSILHRCNTLP